MHLGLYGAPRPEACEEFQVRRVHRWCRKWSGK